MEKNIKRRKCFLAMLTGMLAVSGSSAALSGQFLSAGLTDVMAADQQSISTVNGIAVFGTGTASITITGNQGQTLAGKQFNVYKLFYVEKSISGESVKYIFNPEYEQGVKKIVSAALSTEENKISEDQITERKAVEYIQSLKQDSKAFRYFVEDIRQALVETKAVSQKVEVTDTDGTNSVHLQGLEYGYYIVDEVSAVEDTHSAGSLCMVNTASPDGEIFIKSDYPDVNKKIQEDDENTQIKNQERWNDIGDFEIGQNVPYKFESSVPDMNGYSTYYYAWHDKMDDALTFLPDTVQIKIVGDDGAGSEKQYILDADEYQIKTSEIQDETFQIIVDDLKKITDREFGTKNDQGQVVYGQKVILTYDAVLNDAAADRTGRPGFENDVRLEFSNDADSDHKESTGLTPWDTVVCFTYKINVEKINEHNKKLEGAKFRLYSDKHCKNEIYVKKSEDGYIVINRDSAGGNDHEGGEVPDNAVEMVSSKSGTFIIYGLDSGTYYLKETDAPQGYRLLENTIIISINPAFTDDRDNYVKGMSATEEILQKLDASVKIGGFFNSFTKSDDQKLTTNVQDGSSNLAVINKIGKKLPVTGTSAVLIMLTAGAGMMTWAVAKGRNKMDE